jgi:cephalosporin-C deacetylase-like acetyl esterase
MDSKSVLTPVAEESKTPIAAKLTVVTDRASALYHVGEAVAFEIRLCDSRMAPQDGTVDWVLSKDALKPPLREGRAELQAGVAFVTGTLDEPGFLRCDATIKLGEESMTVAAAAAVDPEKIKPSMPAPEDFDAFWAAKKKELEAVPHNFRLTRVPVPPEHNKAEAFDFQADCVGQPASGYYARPIGAPPGSCPAMLYVHGAGVLSSAVVTVSKWAQKGFITIDLNAHGIPNGRPDEFYAELANGELKDYRTRGRESRETYYFLHMYLRELRALDFLAEQPEWDGRTLIMLGVSQGGAQAIAAAALDSRVSRLITAFPALCDNTGMVVGRISGWPKLVPIDPAGQPDPVILEVSRYFDTVNFAERVKVPTYFSVGFIDTVTPATSSYAAANAIPAPKVVEPEPAYGHGIPNDAFWPRLDALIEAEAVAARKAGGMNHATS